MAVTHVVLNAPDIMCGHCKMAIEGALGKLAGVRAVEVDVAAKSVAVDYDPESVSLEKVEATMAEEGYEVSGRHVFGV
jgi:copper chaperone